MSHASPDHLDRMAKQGFTTLLNLFSPSEVSHMRAAIEEVFARESGMLGRHGAGVRFSINLTNKHAVFREMVQHPVIVGLMAALLGDDFILGSMHTRSTYPGAPEQALHRDWLLDSRIPFPTHINSMWMLDDFTEENGATRVVPGSHLWDGQPEQGKVYPSEMRATGSAGTVTVFDSRLFHGGGANRSTAPRRGLTVFFCRSWAKPHKTHAEAPLSSTPFMPREWNGPALPRDWRG